MQTLDVINDMLGTMGEAPLNALTDPHTFRGAAQRALNRYNRTVQAAGWWFNREKLTITVNPLDFKLYLPGDTIAMRAADARYVQRGNLVYDTVAGTNVFSADTQITVTLVRLVPFESLPELAADYIALSAILWFQKEYDGDSGRTAELDTRVRQARVMVNAEETRSVQANLLDSNTKLQRIKRHVGRMARITGG